MPKLRKSEKVQVTKMQMKITAKNIFLLCNAWTLFDVNYPLEK